MPSRKSPGKPSPDGARRHSKLPRQSTTSPQENSLAPWIGLLACLAISIVASTMANRWGLPPLSPQLLVVLPILLTTGYGAGITVEAARRAGFRDLLLKPSDLESLGDAVNRALILKSNGT
jgi:hypothetical protein